MISYAPIDEILKRPSPPIIQKIVKSDKVEDDEIETECYYVTVVFMVSVILLLTTDMIKK